MLVTLDKVLSDAKTGNYAVAAFNVYNMETVIGVCKAAVETSSPVIMQIYSRLFTEGGAYYLAPVILAAANEAGVPVCLHLDHGASEAEVTRAVRYGCTGIMIDGSRLGLEANIALTKRVVETSSYAGIAVEGELGHIGSASSDATDELTDIDEAIEFVRQTGVYALAVQVGSAHGKYKKPPRLDIGRISEISSATGIPLVLHGGSGIGDAQIVAAIEAGMRKVNFGTDLCCAFIEGIDSVPRNIVAVDKFMEAPIDAVRRFAESKMKLLGSCGRA